MTFEAVKLWGLAIFISALVICNMYLKDKANRLQCILDKQAAVVVHVEQSLKVADTQNKTLSEELSKNNKRIKSAVVSNDCQESMDWMIEQLTD